MPFKKTILIFFSVYFTLTVYGQDGELQSYQNGFYIKQFSEAAGLANNTCNSLFQDSKGFLWVSTRNGLSRFDGKQFVNYGIKEGPPGSNVTQVSEDSSGLIYVATTAGIARYTGYNKSSGTWFYTYPQTTRLAGSIAGMQAIDSNTIIFQKASGAVYLLRKNKLLPLTPDAGSSRINIFRDGNRYFYAAIPDTLRIFNARFENVKNLYWDQASYSPDDMDSADGFHIYSHGKIQRIKDGQVVHERQAPDSITGFANTDTLNSMFYERGRIIYAYNGRFSTPAFSLKNLSVDCDYFIRAKDGSIWVAYSGQGLFRITALPYKSVEMKGAESYYCKKGKLILFDDSSFHKNPAFTRTRDSLKQITVSILMDRKGNAWFCTQRGLYKQPANSPGQACIFHDDKSFWRYGAAYIQQGVELSNGDLWFWGPAGAIRYRNGEFKHYTTRNGLIEKGGATARIVGDKDGNVLLLSEPKKLFYVSGDTVLPAFNAEGTSQLYAGSPRIDNKGYAWIVYNKALYRLEKKVNGRFAFTDSIIPAGINTAEIKTFEFDLQGNCWVNYAGGCIKVFFLNSDGHYDPANSVTYTRDDGLGPLSVSTNTLCPDDNGNMFLIPVHRKRDIGRLLFFSLENVVKRRQLEAPAVHIAGIEINHEKADWLLQGNITGRSGSETSARLPYDENNIIFNYNSSSLRNPLSISYRIMLRGFDKEWRVTNSSSASYTNLPAGSYTFLVQAASVNGTWGPVCAYSFSIRPPWYKTWWATMLWVAFGILIIYLILSIRINSIRINHLKESSLFQSDLITLIGHDMATPLLYIAKVSLQLRDYNEKLSKKTTLESLSEINTTATKLHFFGESIIHWIKVQNSNFKPVMEKFNVNQIIKELVDFHQPLATEKRNKIECEANKNLYCYQDPTLVRIILHNLLLNANKFTVQGKINIAAIKENDRLIITVRDTGKGMDKSKVSSLNRLQPIRSTLGTSEEKGWGMGYKVIIELLKFTGGALLVNSKLNEGTAVTINLPCRENPPVAEAYSRFPLDLQEFRN